LSSSSSTAFAVARATEPELELDASQRSAIAAYDAGTNVFITGSAGCGKSSVLRALLARAVPGEYAALASTNLAALAIGGATLASFLCMWVSDREPAQAIARFRWRGMEARRARLLAVRTLFLDEISLLGDVTLERADVIVRAVCGTPTQPFGGKQLVFVGDFCQLPPVNERFAFLSSLWPRLALRPVYLRTPHRQAGDAAYFAFLQRLRLNAHTPEDVAALRARLVPPGTLVRVPTLVPLRATAEDINTRRLAELDPGSEHTYNACASLVYDDDDDSDAAAVAGKRERSASTRRTHLSKLVGEFLSPPRLVLRLGAPVLLTASTRREDGLGNGSAGTIVGFEAARGGLPLVDFGTPGKHAVCIAPASWRKRNHDEGWTLEYEQVPLLVAYAITTHKSQGMTLAAVALDLGQDVFDKNMAYTALSRAPSYAAILVTRLQEASLAANVASVRFYRELEAELEAEQVVRRAGEQAVEHSAALALAQSPRGIGAEHAAALVAARDPGQPPRGIDAEHAPEREAAV